MAFTQGGHDSNTIAIANLLEEGAPRRASNGGVAHRRFFLGPMPERVISNKEAQTHKKPKTTLGSVFSLTLDADKSHGGDKIEDVTRLVKAHAFRFFLHEGGDPENWDEQQEDNIAEELMRRWKDSDWGKLWSHRHDRHKNSSNGPTSQWFGTSFEVGNLLGVNILEEGEHIHNKNPQLSRYTGDNSTRSGKYAELIARPSNVYAQTRRSMSHTMTTSSLQASHYESAFESPVLIDEPEEATPTTSITELLRRKIPLGPEQDQKTQSQPDLRLPPMLQDANRAFTEMAPGVKGKARMVHYEDLLESNPSVLADSEPVLPEEVLNRTEPHDTSPPPALSPNLSLNSQEDTNWGDIYLKDRMLVRASYTKDEGITHFDEEINRTTRDLSYEDWGEFLVAWRRDSIEIYRDYRTPTREWITGHKHLSYVIPLKSSRTKLSLFSFVDLTFCITCAPTTSKLNTATSRWVFNRDKEGTNIFIFKLKSRSRAYDWVWQLWRSMGGQIAPSVDIHIPRMSTKITIDVPNNGTDEGPGKQVFSRENVIQLCLNTLHDIPDWQYVMDDQIKKGFSLALAWRSKANLDWIWLEKDISGKPRDWAVLCGLPMKQLSSVPLYLEVRLAYHAASHTHLKDGTIAIEPPSIEGYLDRIRPNTQTKQSIYLSIHQGNMFLLNPLTASPPMPPGLHNIQAGNLDSQIENIRHVETRRGMSQIMAATAVLDLRTIVAVRRSFQEIPVHMHTETEGNDEENPLKNFVSEQMTAEDEHDEGGEAGLAKSHDRTHTRMRRSFELLLKTGHVIRFEAHSSKIALEWIDRLRALICYWKMRHRADAKEEIELAQAQRPRLTPQTRIHDDADEEQPPEPPADLSAPFSAMDSLYNWCVLEGCKPLSKTGRLYMRKGLRGQYKLVQLYLVAGHLVRFRIAGQSSLYQAVRKKINLLDAYVCSGHLAAQCLPQGQYRPDARPARRYQDGLETNDREEDMLFMIWYRSQPPIFDGDHDPTATPIATKSVPGISAKSKMLVFKTRSILERDAWCWAINSEIEKIVRAQKVREEMLRETGGLLKLTK